MIQTSIDILPSAHVIEAAIVAFSDELKIDDPQEAAARISTLINGTLDATVLHELISGAGNNATDDVVQMLRMVMATWGTDDPDSVVQDAVRSAGAKQLVITPDHLYMATAVLAGLLVIKPPKSSESRTVKIEESPDGYKKITINEKITYMDPKSALVSLIDRLIQAVGGSGGK